MTRHRRQIALAAVVLLAVLQMGQSCFPVEEGEGPPATIDVSTLQTIPWGGTGIRIVYLQVSVNADDPFQAFDLDIAFDNTNILVGPPAPEPAFDDDGVLFSPGAWGTPFETFEGVTDVRHGPGASGTVAVFSFFLVVLTPDPVTVSVDGEIAGPDGTVFSIVGSTPAVIPSG